MIRIFLLLALLLGGIMLPHHGAEAADASNARHASAPLAKPLPFPRSKRAQAIWAGDFCWNSCQSYCSWDAVACFAHDTQGHCLKFTDRCDRYCQRQCRLRGGPYLPIE